VIDPQIKRLAARYSFAGLLFTAAVIFGVGWAVRDAKNSRGGVIQGPDVPTPTIPPSIEANPGPPAPIRRELVVNGPDGAQRVSCEGACALEMVCGLRDPAACRTDSCVDGLRKPTTSDFKLSTAADCGAMAATPCAEACAKRGECAGTHDGDAQCTRLCESSRDKKKTYASSRCVLENTCAEIARCTQ